MEFSDVRRGGVAVVVRVEMEVGGVVMAVSWVFPLRSMANPWQPWALQLTGERNLSPFKGSSHWYAEQR